MRRRSLQVVPIGDGEDAADAVRRTGALALVVGGGSSALPVVRRLRPSAPELPVIVVDEACDDRALRAAVLTDPLVGRGTRCAAREPVEDLVRLVAEAAHAELRRRRHAEALHRVAHQQLPDALQRPAAASRYLGQLLEHATIGVVAVDPDGTVRGWNPKAEAITGRRARDAVGSPVSSLLPEDQREHLRTLLDAAAGSTGAATAVFTRRGPDGDEQHVEVTAASVDDGGGDLGALVLLADVTERVEAERELADGGRAAALAAAVGQALTSLGPLDVQLHHCTEAVVAHLGAAFARIWRYDPATRTLVLRASAGRYTHLDGEHSRVPLGALKIGRIAASRRPHLTNEVVGDPEISDQAWAEREGMVAFAGYPLVIKDRLLGVLAVFAPAALSRAALDALASAADTIAVGIEQAENAERVVELLDAERRSRRDAEQALRRTVSLARTLQQSLLPPRLPGIPGLEVSARYHWAGTGDVVGGDFYDLFPLRDGRWCAVIGDVSGKGVEAAAITSLARHTLRAAARLLSDPVALLRMLNDVVLEEASGERFCTVALVTIDGDTVTTATAGHPLPLLVEPSGALRPLGEPGAPVGLFDELQVVERRARVGPGDTLVLFTDGVIEARTPTGEFRPGLLHEVLEQTRGRPPHHVTAAVQAAVVELGQGRPRDDLAIVAIRWQGPAAGPR